MRSQKLAATVVVFALFLAVGLAGCTLLSPGPRADFDVKPLVPYANEPVTLDASPSSGDLVHYTWDLDSAGNASGREVTAAFPKPGHYTVRLTVEDAQGRVVDTARQITVYSRSGTRIFSEDFSDGEAALGRWPLDPTWASQNESNIELLGGAAGYALFIHSGIDRWNRRSTPIELPPLRIGQRLTFSFEVMTLQNQDAHTFTIAPARRNLADPADGLPYYVYTSNGDGSYIREPSSYGTVVGHPVPFKPSIYRWHTYVFSYSEDQFVFSVDGEELLRGAVPDDLLQGGLWRIVLGDESHTEACDAYYDDILVMVEE